MPKVAFISKIMSFLMALVMCEHADMLGHSLRMIYRGTPYEAYMTRVERIMDETNYIKNKNELIMANLKRN